MPNFMTPLSIICVKTAKTAYFFIQKVGTWDFRKVIVSGLAEVGNNPFVCTTVLRAIALSG